MASGDTLFVFTSRSNHPPAANFATADERNGVAVLDFDASTNEQATFFGVMPQHYDGGGVSVRLHFAMTSATSGDVDVDAKFQRHTDILGDDYAAAQSVDDTTVPGTAGNLFVVAVAFTDGAQMDSVGAGDPFRLSVIRDAVSDTATGDAELVAIEIRES
jgi:dihydroxyacetone kinase